MKVVLVHNPTAGAGDWPRSRLLDAVRKAGFDPDYLSLKEDRNASSLQDPGALVLIAGGDGAVIKVARTIAGSPFRIAILPIGTANNIARSLDLPLEMDRALGIAVAGRARPFSLGALRCGDRRRLFLEGAGVGLFPAVLGGAWEPLGRDGSRDPLGHDLRRWSRVLDDSPSRHLRVFADGALVADGEFVLAEVLNIPLLGPRLRVSSTKAPGEGSLELALVPEAEREVLMEHLRSRGEGANDPLPATVFRASHFRITGEMPAIRVDDRLWEDLPAAPGGERVLFARGSGRWIHVLVPA